METVKFDITGYDVFPNGTVKPSALLRHMQAAAIKDAAKLGADYDAMREKDMIFVLTKLRLKFFRLPRFCDALEIRTWNREVKGVCFDREYAMYVKGELSAAAVSRWALVSFKNRAILRPDAIGKSVVTNPDETLGIEFSRRIKPPEGLPATQTSHKASFSELDINGHVNNSRYADYLVDYSGIDLNGKLISGLEIHFQNEFKAGETLSVGAVSDGTEAFVTGVKENGTTAFSAWLAVFKQ